MKAITMHLVIEQGYILGIFCKKTDMSGVLGGDCSSKSSLHRLGRMIATRAAVDGGLGFPQQHSLALPHQSNVHRQPI